MQKGKESDKITAEGFEKFVRKPRNVIILVLCILALIGAIISGYFLVMSAKTCSTEACFKTGVEKCSPAIYTAQNSDTALLYTIKGISGTTCVINVRLLGIKQGSIELNKLIGKDMDCSITLGTYSQPEKDIKKCRGKLKESIQEIIIQRMQSQIIENIGEISAKLTQVL